MFRASALSITASQSAPCPFCKFRLQDGKMEEHLIIYDVIPLGTIHTCLTCNFYSSSRKRISGEVDAAISTAIDRWWRRRTGDE